MRIIFWQIILMKYTLFVGKFGTVFQNVSSAVVVIGPLRANSIVNILSGNPNL